MHHDDTVELQPTGSRLSTSSRGRRAAVIGVNAALMALAAWAFIGMRAAADPDVAAAPMYSTTTVAYPATDTTAAPSTTTPPTTAAPSTVVEDTATSTTVQEEDGTPQPTTPTPTMPPAATTTVLSGLQDIYGDICVPMEWVNCAEYIIYGVDGEVRNRVIANSDWTIEYIAEASGGGPGGTAVKVRDIYPCDTCVSYV